MEENRDIHGRVQSRSLQLTNFSAQLFTALALIPAGAHLAEVVHKLRFTESEYRVVQQIYAGWSLLGIVMAAAILSTLLLAVDLRNQPRAFVPAVVASTCLAGTQVIFWGLTFPVNGRSTGACFHSTGATRERNGSIRMRWRQC
jgi:hypothetical protein